MNRISLSFWFLFVSTAFSYIPPLANILKEVSEGRRVNTGMEFNFHHHLTTGDTTDWDERWVADKNGMWVSLKNPQGNTYVARWERGVYVFGTEQVSSPSQLFVKYFLADSSDTLREALLREQFIHRDHLYQYKPNYNPSGDPASWDLLNNIILHQDIYFTKTGQLVAIRVDGAEGRSVYFDKDLQGIRRFEWSESGNLSGWDFSHFFKAASAGNYPKQLSFNNNKVEKVQSELISVKALNAKGLAEASHSLKAQRARNEALGSNSEEIRLLLSFR